MLTMLRKRFDKDEEGFTLIELMVVVLIIAILLAIAIPTFLGARERAQDRAAQSDLRNALTAAKTLYVDDQVYTAASTTALAEVEPSLTFTEGASTEADREVSVWTSADTINLQVMSASGQCWQLTDVATGADAGTVGPVEAPEACEAADPA